MASILLSPPMTDVTRLLHAAAAGDTSATEGLLPLIYGELHRLASQSMRGQDVDHTLQPTALIHEAWLKLVHLQDPAWTGRRHFLGVAAKAMRAILIDHARGRSADKRGGGRRAMQLDADTIAVDESESLLELHGALERLGELDESLARLVELRFFGGLTVEEAAEVLEVSTRTVKRSWRTAKAWLQRELDPEATREAD